MALRKDQRVRLTVKGSYDLPFNGPGEYVRPTNGIVFPYTPLITTSQSVNYSPGDMVHNNYQQQSYSGTPNPDIIIQSKFISQTPDEARYTIGALHFLRVVTKMHFGKDDYAGAPPPVLNFSAYGPVNFNNVPVVVSMYSPMYDDEMDYIEVEVRESMEVTAGPSLSSPVITPKNGMAHVPVEMSLSINLLPHYNPDMQRRFNMGDFASGRLYKEGFV